jgi:hypothetical protein
MYKLIVWGTGQNLVCGIPACIYLGIDISLPTEALNFHCNRNEIISLITWAENSKLDNL